MTDTSKRPRVAVVGSGYWGKNLVRNLHELGALEAVCDLNEDRLRAMQAEHGPSLRAETSYTDLLADDSIDAVVLATPAVTHQQMASQALEAGKDVLVEKPLATSIDGGEQLVELAAAKEQILMVGHLLWYHPAIIELKRLVDDGTLGHIRYIYSNRLNFGKVRTEENILWSFAPHDISVILGILGEMPTHVHAEGGTFLSPDVADVTVSTLGFPGGARAHIFVSWLHPFKEQRLVVIGEDKMAAFEDGPDGGTLDLYAHSIDWSGAGPHANKKHAERVEVPAYEPLRAEIEHFLDCVTTRNRPRTDGAEGLRVLRVLSQCQDSLQRNG